MPDPHHPFDDSVPLQGQVFSFTGSQVNYRTLLYNVFMHPKLAMALFALVNRYWLLTLSTLLLLCMVGGCGIAMSRVPNFATDIRQTTDFLLDTVGPITIQDGKLEWDTPAEGTLPATARFPHLRVDIVETRADFQAYFIQANDRAGLVVAHDGIRFWRNLRQEDQTFSTNDSSLPEATIPPAMLQNLPDLSSDHDNATSAQITHRPFVLNRKTQSQVCKLVFLSMFVACTVEQAIEVITAILGCAFILAITISFILRIHRIRSFFALLLFALNAVIPAAVAAMVYLIAEIGSDFQTMFTIMLGVYLVYSLIEGRRGTVILPPQK